MSAKPPRSSFSFPLAAASVALGLAAAAPAPALGMAPAPEGARDPGERPLMRDFIGINGHTIQVRPALYRPAARLMRDYHNLDWDLGDSTANPIKLPYTTKRIDSPEPINWVELYGSWAEHGIETNLCVQFANGFEEGEWGDLAGDAYRYGQALGRTFTAGSGAGVTSIQIGNEPGGYSDEAYRTVLENMARGVKETNPGLLVVTCNMDAQPRGKYWQSTSVLLGVPDELVDVIATHKYPLVEHYPTWRRSYPEDPATDFLPHMERLLRWRDEHAPGKQVWVTEFGYDASTKEPEPEGTFKDWVDVTDKQQAQYLVRGFLVLAAAGVDRAYMYFFNDADKPSFHASSGLTRNYEPKPAYYAQSHLLTTLGDYRFARAVTREDKGLHVFEFTHGGDEARRVWVVWSATGDDRSFERELTGLPGRVVKAERMPLVAGGGEPVTIEQTDGGVTLTVTESPAYLWIEAE